MAPAENAKKVVKKAIKMKDPVNQLDCYPPFEDRRTLDGELISFKTCWATHLTEEESNWAFDLFKENMYDLYTKSQWGWDPESKKQELGATTARYLVAYNATGDRVGYAHYRFDVDHTAPVVYCYEIQVCEKYQKKGIGSLLIQTLENLCARTGMEKVMATVFAFNAKSLGFFHKLGYEADVTCPDENRGLDYLILSKVID
ncbi:unnamed protein product [Auanema sp. JU1783]|nr:unnamed protein product [Auanema sp. JU1783]